MVFSVKLGRFLGMMLSLEVMAVRGMRVVASAFVVALLMHLGSFLMMFGCVFEVLRCAFVMFRAFVFRHLSNPLSIWISRSASKRRRAIKHGAGILPAGWLLIAFGRSCCHAHFGRDLNNAVHKISGAKGRPISRLF
jgi:hypothetical protein